MLNPISISPQMFPSISPTVRFTFPTFSHTMLAGDAVAISRNPTDP
jgi:hypothetical protein